MLRRYSRKRNLANFRDAVISSEGGIVTREWQWLFDIHAAAGQSGRRKKKRRKKTPKRRRDGVSKWTRREARIRERGRSTRRRSSPRTRGRNSRRRGRGQYGANGKNTARSSASAQLQPGDAAGPPRRLGHSAKEANRLPTAEQRDAQTVLGEAAAAGPTQLQPAAGPPVSAFGEAQLNRGPEAARFAAARAVATAHDGVEERLGHTLRYHNAREHGRLARLGLAAWNKANRALGGILTRRRKKIHPMGNQGGRRRRHRRRRRTTRKRHQVVKKRKRTRRKRIKPRLGYCAYLVRKKQCEKMTVPGEHFCDKHGARCYGRGRNFGKIKKSCLSRSIFL